MTVVSLEKSDEPYLVVATTQLVFAMLAHNL